MWPPPAPFLHETLQGVWRSSAGEKTFFLLCKLTKKKRILKFICGREELHHPPQSDKKKKRFLLSDLLCFLLFSTQEIVIQEEALLASWTLEQQTFPGRSLQSCDLLLDVGTITLSTMKIKAWLYSPLLLFVTLIDWNPVSVLTLGVPFSKLSCVLQLF